MSEQMKSILAVLLAVACVDRDVKTIAALQQRVAQLEGELDEARRKLGKIETRCPSCQNTTLFISDHGASVCSWLGCKNPVPERFIAALQADHARVLGLVRALPLVNGVLGVRVAEVELGNMWAITVDGYFDGNSALFETENEANAYMALLKYRASLPAQPAQGGAKCVWVDDEGGIYQTGCKHAFMVDPDSDEPPIWIKFCCYCGSLVEFFVPAAEGETRA